MKTNVKFETLVDLTQNNQHALMEYRGIDHVPQIDSVLKLANVRVKVKSVDYSITDLIGKKMPQAEVYVGLLDGVTIDEFQKQQRK